jgi:hypothetical protein
MTATLARRRLLGAAGPSVQWCLVSDDAVAPDTKDWTWVLDRPCPQCGLDAGTVPAEEVGRRIAGALPRWERALGRGDVARRPSPGAWSPLEYSCHVRDVCRVMLGRLEAMLTQDGPVFADWDQDEAAVAGRYGEADPADVARQLAAAGAAVAAAFDAVVPAERDRAGERSDGARFTVTTLGRYTLHELVHHLWDVRG